MTTARFRWRADLVCNLRKTNRRMRRQFTFHLAPNSTRTHGAGMGWNGHSDKRKLPGSVGESLGGKGGGFGFVMGRGGHAVGKFADKRPLGICQDDEAISFSRAYYFSEVSIIFSISLSRYSCVHARSLAQGLDGVCLMYVKLW